jgi:hypothetical protein
LTDALAVTISVTIGLAAPAGLASQVCNALPIGLTADYFF